MPIIDARVIFVWATAGGTAVNTLDARYDDANISAQGVADSFRDNIQGTFLQHLTSSTALTQVQVGDDAMGAIAAGSASGGDSDTGTNPSVSYGVTKVCSTGRNGRWFIPGVSEDGVEDTGSVPTAKRGLLQTEMTNFLAAMEADGVDMRVKQKDLTYSQIDSFNVRPFVTLQSRRLRRARG